MNSNKKSDIEDKLVKGLAESFEKLKEEKRRNGQELIVSKNGKIVAIKP